jgi:hypothetical protein
MPARKTHFGSQAEDDTGTNRETSSSGPGACVSFQAAPGAETRLRRPGISLRTPGNNVLYRIRWVEQEQKLASPK